MQLDLLLRLPDYTSHLSSLGPKDEEEKLKDTTRPEPHEAQQNENVSLCWFDLSASSFKDILQIC